MNDFANYLPRDQQGRRAYATWVEHQLLLREAARLRRTIQQRDRAERRAARLRRRAQHFQQRAAGAELRAHRLAHL